jgi:heme-degrading monooxygenase HmoA
MLFSSLYGLSLTQTFSKENEMRRVFIDKFVVPQNGFDEFIRRMNYNRSFIRNLPGFVHDAAYRRNDENGNAVVMTIAIWESEDAILKARAAVQTEYARIGFRPEEMMARLNITLDRGTYT